MLPGPIKIPVSLDGPRYVHPPYLQRELRRQWFEDLNDESLDCLCGNTIRICPGLISRYNITSSKAQDQVDSQ
jgi:hypothetical protein